MPPIHQVKRRRVAWRCTLEGWKVQPDIARNHQDAVAGSIFVAVAENGLPRLRFDDLTFNFLQIELCHRVSERPPRSKRAAMRRLQTKKTLFLRSTLGPEKPQARSSVANSQTIVKQILLQSTGLSTEPLRGRINIAVTIP